MSYWIGKCAFEHFAEMPTQEISARVVVALAPDRSVLKLKGFERVRSAAADHSTAARERGIAELDLTNDLVAHSFAHRVEIRRRRRIERRWIYWFFGEEVAKRSERELTALRRTGVGFIFQSFNLIDDLNVAENVEVSLLYRRIGGGERRKRVAAALERVGIAHRARHLPHQLSGGQQQRVAIARALVAEPKLILADEPTGNLDTENGTAVMALLTEINGAGTTVVMVTHSLVHAGCAKRTVKLLDGRVVSETQLAA